MSREIFFGLMIYVFIAANIVAQDKEYLFVVKEGKNRMELLSEFSAYQIHKVEQLGRRTFLLLFENGVALDELKKRVEKSRVLESVQPNHKYVIKE